MAIKKFWIMAYRDLGRNRRRSFFTFIAVAMGLGLLILMSGFIAGAWDTALENNIRLNTGHIQIRAESYEEGKSSLLWQDLVEEPEAITAQAKAMDGVEAATAVLWAGGVLNTVQESTGLRVTGIEPDSTFHDPVRNGIIEGEYLTPDVRGEILVGKRLADSMGIGVGERVSLAVGNQEGQPDEGIFTVRGLFNTGIPGYDDNTVFMPLSQAQSFTRAGNRASAIIILLDDSNNAEAVAAALQNLGTTTQTWVELNAVLLDTVSMANSFYIIMYGIVIMVVAVIIANTLLMAVFERTREMGILAALGMKGRQIMLMFLFEASILALIGIFFGIILGSLAVWYLGQNGIFIGEESASLAEGIAISATMYTKFVPGDIISLSFWTLAVILLASLYPAWYAARLEPVSALHTL